MKIVNYSPEKHSDDLFSLWNETLGKEWPIEKEVLLKQIDNGGVSGSFVFEQKGKLVGFLSTKLGRKGEIQLIAVNPKVQRQGVGTKLLNKAMEYFYKKGVKEVQLGAGANPYFWPGVPSGSVNALNLFKKNGWVFDEESVDMVGDLVGFTSPSEIFEKTKKLGVRFTMATNEVEKEIINFEKKHFPEWEKYFTSALKGESGEDILLAMNGDKILGSALVGEKQNIWSKILSDKVGTIGALGVDKSVRGQGIGLALAARATELLRDKGLTKSYLGWTWLVDWYGKLGYKVWRKYQMSTKIEDQK